MKKIFFLFSVLFFFKGYTQTSIISRTHLKNANETGNIRYPFPQTGISNDTLTTKSKTLNFIDSSYASGANMIFKQADGTTITVPVPGGGGGVITVGTVNSTATANAASITGTTINLHAADATNPGIITTGTQTLPGTYTFVNSITSRAVVPSTTATYNLGSSSVAWANVYSAGYRALTALNMYAGATSNAVTFNAGASELARFSPTNGNFLIGTTTDGGFRLDVTGTGRFTSTLRVGAYTLPATDGTANQVLKTNGSGTLTWSADNNSGSSEIAFQTLTDGATTTFDYDLGVTATWTLGGNRTLAIQDVPQGKTILIRIKQDATGNRTVTWPSSIKTPNGAAIVLSTAANAEDIFSLWYDGTYYNVISNFNFLTVGS